MCVADGPYFSVLAPAGYSPGPTGAYSYIFNNFEKFNAEVFSKFVFLYISNVLFIRANQSISSIVVLDNVSRASRDKQNVTGNRSANARIVATMVRAEISLYL